MANEKRVNTMGEWSKRGKGDRLLGRDKQRETAVDKKERGIGKDVEKGTKEGIY